jgi:hypothetical protein
MNRLFAGLVLAGLIAVSPAVAGGEIYGTVHTIDGKKYTGPISWDDNENYWADRLDTLKKKTVEETEKDKGFRMSLFGLDLGGERHSSRNRLSVNFGHLRTVERVGGAGRAALVTLKNGETIEVRAEDRELGHGMRGLMIDGPEGNVKVRWSNLQRVEFRANPDKGTTRDSERLYGTVETTQGSYVGFVTWDRDECRRDDVLDGYSDGQDHEIPFNKIKSIATRPDSAEVGLTDGTSIVLDGTNDVNDDQRGTIVETENGAVQVPWRELVKVEFDETPPSPTYESFDGGQRLRGTVRTRGGKAVSGLIAWDLDESHTFETLDGDGERLEYSIPFGRIRSVSRHGARFSEVTLKNGEKLTLSGSNDVDKDNRGLMVTAADGTETRIEWEQTISVEFE